MNAIVKAYRERHRDMVLHPWEYYVEPFCIAGNLYFVGNRDGASHLVDTGDGLILFDTNYPSAAPLLLHSIWKAGFNPENIRMIFHTHGHYDHFGATALLKALSGAKTYLGERDAEMFRMQPELALLDLNAGAELELFEPDQILRDNDIVRLGNTCVRAVDTAGHSPGAMSYVFNVDADDTHWQAILHGGAGFNTLTREFEETYHCCAEREHFAGSLKRLRGIQADIFLGNHTPQSQTMEKRERMLAGCGNPFIDPSAWTSYLDDLEERFAEFCAVDK